MRRTRHLVSPLNWRQAVSWSVGQLGRHALSVGHLTLKSGCPCCRHRRRPIMILTRPAHPTKVRPLGHRRISTRSSPVLPAARTQSSMIPPLESFHRSSFRPPSPYGPMSHQWQLSSWGRATGHAAFDLRGFRGGRGSIDQLMCPLPGCEWGLLWLRML